MTKEEAFSSVNNIAKNYCEHGWGGHDEKPVTPETVQSAKDFVLNFFYNGGEVESITVDTDGSLHMTAFGHNSWSMSICVYEDIVTYGTTVFPPKLERWISMRGSYVRVEDAAYNIASLIAILRLIGS